MLPEEEPRQYKTLDEVKVDLVSHQGVLTLVMWQVRDAYGAGRLGVNVRENISDQLAGLGIRHIPKSLPDNQLSFVRLYTAGSPAGRLIEAAHEIGYAEDAAIREAAASDARQILNRVKDLVCS